MNTQDIDLIRDCLPEGRTKYHYFKNRYVWHVLAWHLGNRQVTVNSLKSDPHWRRFIQKPQFTDFLKQLPTGLVCRDQLLSYWPIQEVTYPFRLTLDEWGSDSRSNDEWHQKSRAGWNLVLQLNFSSSHDNCYNSLFPEEDPQLLFGFRCHPSRFGEMNTMAWARLDIDLDGGTALIEEIQNDWLRRSSAAYHRLKQMLVTGETYLNSQWRCMTVGKFLDYHERHVVPLLKVWDEAMLTATLWFLHKELGINHIHMHTWESGLVFKRLNVNFGPPRSLYTHLPKKFGFTRSQMGPPFLANRKVKSRKTREKMRSLKPVTWWRLDLNP